MTVRAAQFLHDLRRLAAGSAVDPAPDAELLERFIRRRDEGAFAALVARHGPMVLRLCRRTAIDAHAAEDCFQATFLVLARKAASVRRRDALAAWLYGVAARVARQSRAACLRRRTGPPVPAEGAPADPHPDPLDALTVRELLTAVDEEVNRLPEVYRLPVLLCCLEGRTREEAARQLGWTEGAVKGRLERGRARLRARLAKRGLTLSAALAVVEVSRGAACIPAALAADAVRSALSGTAAAGVARLADEALRAAVSGKGKIALAVLLALGTAALGIGVLPPPAGREPPGESKQAVENPAPKTAPGSDRAGKDIHGDPLPPRALARLGTVRFRHGEQVNQIAISPDGRALASTSRDKTVRLWDWATGQELRRFGQADREGLAVAFSPDGTLLAESGANFEGVVLWDAKTGREVRRLREPRDWYHRLVFSPNGKILAGAANRHRIALWDVETGRVLRRLDGKEDSPVAPAIAFSLDGRTLASVRKGRVIQLWDPTTGEKLRRMQHPSPPEPKKKSDADSEMFLDLQFSPDGKILASGGASPDICLWEAATGKELSRWPAGDSGWLTLAFSPDGRFLAAGDTSGLVRLWEAATGKEASRLSVARGWVTSVRFSRDGHTLATSQGKAIRLWDVRTGKEAFSDRGHTNSIGQCAALPDGRELITGSMDGTIRRWDLSTGRELSRASTPNLSYESSVLSPDGKTAASFVSKRANGIQWNEEIRLWDLATRKERKLPVRPNIFGAVFSPDSKTVFTMTWEDKERKAFLRMWETATGKELRVVAEHPRGFGHFTLSPDGKLLAAKTGDEKDAIRVWQVDTGKELCRVAGHPEFNLALAFAPGRNLLAVLDGMRYQQSPRVLVHHIHLWDITSSKKVLEFGRSSIGHWPGTFSPDGRILAAADEDCRIRLWEVATGSERLILEGHAGWVQQLLFAEQGRKLISSSSDTTALVWDVSGWRLGDDAQKQLLRRADLEALWVDLISPDAAQAGRAVWALAAAPREAVPFLREKLRPARPADPRQVRRLLADLHSDRFPVRARAERELGALEELAEPFLREELAKQPVVEVRRRIEKLLEPLEKALLTGERLLSVRAVEVLEHVGSPDAREVLRRLAEGAPATRQTREAAESLGRLQRREAAP